MTRTWTFSDAPQGAKWLIFDFDTTLSSLEGIDELARMQGEESFYMTKALTERAMEGVIRIEDVFAERIDFLHPPITHFEKVTELYWETIEPTAEKTIRTALKAGWTPMILSGGFRPAIKPIADRLGIPYVEAVDVFFDEQGEYVNFDRTYPTVFQDGKPTIINTLKSLVKPEKIFMIGDGATDKLTEPFVDMFFAFGRYTQRPAVWDHSTNKIRSLDALLNYITQ
jgi:phosphoserine phosphatase